MRASVRRILFSPCLFLLLLGVSSASVLAQDTDPDGPGKLEITTEPPETLTEGAYAKFTVKTAFKTGDKIDWEISPRPIRAERIGTVFVVNGVKGQTYTLKVWVVNTTGGKNGRWDKGVVDYTFGGKKVVPPPKEDPVPDPKEPDPKEPPVGKYYFVVVRPDGAASPAFTKAMQDPAWAQLRLGGHTVKDFTVTDAKERLKIDTDWTPLPAVVTLSVKDNKSYIVRPAVPLPAGDAILKLAELK